jgi:hypothetical protein
MIARCYNGCWDSETQRQIDAEEAQMALLRTFEPQAHCTYFPIEGRYQIHVFGKPLSEFHGTRATAIAEALKRFQDIGNQHYLEWIEWNEYRRYFTSVEHSYNDERR